LTKGTICKPVRQARYTKLFYENFEALGTTAVSANASIRDDESRPKVSVLFEGVKATVAALAAGTISIGEISKNTDTKLLRYAPSFVQGVTSVDSTPVPYTADSIGLFLGETTKSGKATQNLCTVLNALELIERKMLSERELDGLSITQIVNLIPIAVNRYPSDRNLYQHHGPLSNAISTGFEVSL
jgi:hypothetical protein